MLINDDINFNTKLVKHTNVHVNPHEYWYSLELEFGERCDTVMSSKIVLNTVTRQDMMNLAECFRDLAGQF